MQIISLATYDIFIGDFWQDLKEFLVKKNYSKIAIIVDENTKQFCLPLLQKKIEIEEPTIIEIQSGEFHKNIETCTAIWQKMMDAQFDRNALTINLGGGVIGDMGGFCASTFKRGMDFIQLPTTLLSQVDASIGGKLGIDFGEIKNSVGLFQNPKAVFVEPAFLKTLSEREIRSGFAEIIKHGLIADKRLWQTIIGFENLQAVNWASILEPSLAIKKSIVEEDPFEKGLRKALNFGHTIGHAIESVALNSVKPLLHGEAIAIGMACEAWLSFKLVGLTLENLEKVFHFLMKIYDPVLLNQANFPTFIDLMKQDKKNEGDLINFTLIEEIGKAKINQTCEEGLILESLEWYNQKVSALR